MKRSKTILVLFLATLALAFFGGITASNGAAGSFGTTSIQHGITSVQDLEGKQSSNAILKEHFATEGSVIKRTTRTSSSTRNENDNDGDPFFISFIAYSQRILIDAATAYSNLQFEPQQLKLIFPFHYFW